MPIFALPHLKGKDEELAAFRKAVGNWGNPSGDNIDRLFSRVGVMGIIDKVTWQKTDGKRIRARLKFLNERRNQIAHGKRIKGSLKLAEIESTRDFVEQFSINLNRYLARHFRRQLV